MKKSGWGVAGVSAYILLRIALIAMRHPDWTANDWIGFAGVILGLVVVVLIIVLIVKKIRGPKTSPTINIPEPNVPTMQMNLPSNAQPAILAQALSPIESNGLAGKQSPAGTRCAHCGNQFDADAQFCCECGSVVA
jgi:hypothetical protein